MTAIPGRLDAKRTAAQLLRGHKAATTASEPRHDAAGFGKDQGVALCPRHVQSEPDQWFRLWCVLVITIMIRQ